MIRQTSLVFLALFGCTAASATDNRIRTLRYDPNQIVTIPGKSGIQSTIEFGSDEHIESVAVGNSEAWQVTPNHRASLLFVKPLVALSHTNMTVITDQRTYMFDLVTGRHAAAPIYSLKFSYPGDPAAKIEQARVVAPAPTPAPPSPVQLNFAWKTKGAGGLLPARVFDDGTSLYLAWTRNALLPSVSTLAEDGREASLNYRVAGEYIVVTPVPANILLRYGKKTATAFRVEPERPSPHRRREVVRQAEARSMPAIPVLSEPPATQAAPRREPAVAGPQVVAAITPPEPHATLGDRLAYQALDNDQLTDDHHE